MKMVTRWIAALACFAAWGAPALAQTPAQDWPNKQQIRFWVGFTPGGATDVVARIVAPRLSEKLGAPIIIMNLPGASASLAVQRVVRSAPDGYNILVSSATDTAQPALRNDLGYDLEKDLTPISILGSAPMALVVGPQMQVNNVGDLVKMARANPGKLTYASAGVGSVLHFAGELLKVTENIDMVHVPYKGASEVVTATASGEVSASFVILSAAQQLIKAGRLKPLGVTSIGRFPVAPEMPTLDEQGVRGYDISAWWGLHAPAGTPPAILEKMNQAVKEVLAEPDVQKNFAAQGLTPRYLARADFGTFFKNDIALARRLVSSTKATGN